MNDVEIVSEFDRVLEEFNGVDILISVLLSNTITNTECKADGLVKSPGKKS